MGKTVVICDVIVRYWWYVRRRYEALFSTYDRLLIHIYDKPWILNRLQGFTRMLVEARAGIPEVMRIAAVGASSHEERVVILRRYDSDASIDGTCTGFMMMRPYGTSMTPMRPGIHGRPRTGPGREDLGRGPVLIDRAGSRSGELRPSRQRKEKREGVLAKSAHRSEGRPSRRQSRGAEQMP